MFLVYVLCFCLIVFGCQYQCNRLPGKTHFRDDLLCIEWDFKPYTHYPTTVTYCLYCYAVVACEMKLFRNNFVVISVFFSHVNTSETEIKVFQPLNEFR